MGGRGRSRTQRKHFRQSRENVWKRPKSDDAAVATSDDSKIEASNRHWEPFTVENPTFDEYYKEQGVVSSEEWDVFVECLRKPLPSAFRINSSSPFYEDIRLQLENDFSKSIQAEDVDGIEVDPIKPLSWYPDNLAWQANFSRNQLRKTLTLERFHEFLKLENEIGNITRQEAVSMVPPLFLDVCPEHFVLDMCAAPGSKTFQLLEMIYKPTPAGTLPSGLVIANDLDVQRCNLLIHQTKRMCTANLIVTNHEAQHFPSCHFHKNLSLEQGISQLQFDRVLCDVPCSGDGTLRKAPDIWRKWNSGMGNGLHGLQVQIAMRGLSLLKVGGRMVYSTCSMNPVEDEAVVAELLRRCEGSIQLLNVSSELPDLARRPGLRKWKVHDKGLWLGSYKDLPKHRRSVITPGMFPSGKFIEDTSEEDGHATEIANNCEEELYDSDIKLQTMEDDSVPKPKNELEIEISDLPLERCMRIVPHDQNSGAFFIAVIQKLSPLPAPHTSANKPVTKSKKTDQSEKLKNPLHEDSNGHDIHEKDVQEFETTHGNIVTADDSCGEASLDIDRAENEEENLKQDSSTNVKTGVNTAITGKRKLQMQGRWRGVDPVIFYKDDAVIDMIIEFYGIKETFPFKGHLITRNDDTNHVKRIYYVSDSVRTVLELNLKSGQHLKIASVGLKMFERQTSKTGTSTPCLFRISSEGLPLILPHITKQILYASPVDFKHLLQHKSIKFADFVNTEIGDKASKLIMLGCCVVVLRTVNRGHSAAPSKEEFNPPISIGCWRGRSNISVMVTEVDCQELLQRVSMLVSTANNNDGNDTNDVSAASEAVRDTANGSQAKQDDDTTM